MFFPTFEISSWFNITIPSFSRSALTINCRIMFNNPRFLCLIKRDCITVNGVDDYYSKGMNVDDIQSNISRVMSAIDK